jgi:hypothetical protein
MSGHRHNSNAGTQNQGNSLGDRACVRQSKLYRTHESGNDVKSILGTSHLCWDAEQQEGAYKGHKVFDHTKPNSVSNEMRAPSYESTSDYPPMSDARARSNEMKRNMNNDYANDWSTESGSYKGSTSHRSQGSFNDENRMVRSNSGRQVDPSDYEKYAPSGRMASSRVPATSNMGGMSLSQFQTESANYAAPQQTRRTGGNTSQGFASAMVQPDRVPNSDRSGYEYKNNIYGQDDAGYGQQSGRQGGIAAAAYNPYKTQSSAPYAADDYSDQYQPQSQYRAQYPEPARDSYDNYPSGSGREGYGQSQGYPQDSYAIPGIAPEGANNREGRSTRPW